MERLFSLLGRLCYMATKSSSVAQMARLYYLFADLSALSGLKFSVILFNDNNMDAVLRTLCSADKLIYAR